MGDVLCLVQRRGATLGAGAIANDPRGGVLQVTALFLHEPQRSGQMIAGAKGGRVAETQAPLYARLLDSSR